MEDTNLAQAISATNDSGSTYDTNIKFLLADKQILSWILKYTLDEFKDMDVLDIRNCIGNDIDVDTKSVEPGLSNLGRIKGTLTEDSVPGEGTIYYDIRFTVYCRDTEMKILVNLEAQMTSDANKLGYHLENRIIFYLARMISAQKQTEFFHSDFDDLKPVRSIWICMDSDVMEDSIEEIGFESRLAYGNTKNRHKTDLIKGIIVNIRSSFQISDVLCCYRFQPHCLPDTCNRSVPNAMRICYLLSSGLFATI